MDVAALEGVAFFVGFSVQELEQVAELAELRDFAAGDVVIDQGRVGLECHVILQGQARVLVGDQHVATVGRGSIVGETALVEHRPRVATVVADAPLRVATFDVKQFRLLLAAFPELERLVQQLVVERSGVTRDLR